MKKPSKKSKKKKPSKKKLEKCGCGSEKDWEKCCGRCKIPC